MKSITVKAFPLIGFSLNEILVAFVRMAILSHILTSYEFGFAAAISVTFATLMQISDLALHRFVFFAPRAKFSQVIAGAHALTIIRCVAIGSFLLAISYPLSCMLAGCANWSSFAMLAPIIFIASFEHLELKVVERDYRYWPQFIASIVSHGLGLIVLVVTAFQTQSHIAFTIYLYVQVFTYILASHLLSSAKYALNFRSPHIREGISFGLPLTLNGVGLALLGQGDRLLVGGLLDLQSLAAYTILLLSAIVPVSALLRIMSPVILTALKEEDKDKQKLQARVRLYGFVVPALAGGYALVIIALLKSAVPLVFGYHFVISELTVFLIASVAFIRIVRTEPYMSLLFSARRTGTIAAVNLSQSIGLIIAASLLYLSPRLESAIIGVMTGDIFAFLVVTFATRHLIKTIYSYNYRALCGIIIVVASVMGLIWITGAQELLVSRIEIATGGMLLIVLAGVVFVPTQYRKAYR